ncbi:MAG: hypothetical protein ACI9U2_001000 [Bradymonadia bacterium]|jgi:hypothetical protein
MRALIAPSLVALSLLCGLPACSPPAPSFVQVDAPGDTRDAQGAYRITAVMRGVVDRVVVIVEPTGDAEDEAEPIFAILTDRGDGRFEGGIPGVQPGARLTLTLRAEGPGGDANWPSDGAHAFRIFDASGACLVDGDCLDGEMCDRQREQCIDRSLDCTDSGVCPLDYECDAQRGECRFRRTACEGDADCGRGRVCEDALCVARPECRDDAECPDGSRCLTPPGRCVGDDECASALDCPADRPICQDNQCVAGDACPGGCEPGAECVGGQCIVVGLCGEECSPGTFCSAIVERCVECTADGHCGPGRSCHDQTCSDAPRGAPCTPCGPDGACGVGYTCDLDFGGLCSRLCDDGGECPAGLFCDGNLCRSEQVCGAFECFNDDECEGACLAGVCDAPQLCEGDADCAEAWTCEGDRCVPRAGSCFSPFDCDRGEICLGGRCEVQVVGGECRPCEQPSDCPSPALCGDVDGSGLRCLSICGPNGCADGLECNDLGGIGLCLPFDGICPDGACGQDAFEDAEPLRMPPDQRIQRQVCARDADEFALTVRGTLRIMPDGPILIELANLVTGRERREALDAGDVFDFEIEDATFALTVTTDSPFDVGYTIEIQTGPPPMCDDDILEDNDTQQTATIIGDGANINPTLCDGDADWYRIRLDNGQTGTVVVSVRDPQRAPLTYQLVTGDGRVVSGGEVFDGGADLRVAGDADGLFLQVFCEGCDALRYNIRSQFDGGGGECPQDAFEPNDSIDAATRVAVPADSDGLFVCNGDEDFFTIAVPARTRMRIDLTFRHGAGDIDSELLEDGQQIDASTSGTDNEQIDLPVSRRDAVYVLRVYLFPSTPQNGYRLRVREL